MRRWSVLLVFLVGFGLASPHARADLRDIDDLHMYGWKWKTPPAPEPVRACVAELEHLGKAHPDLVRVLETEEHDAVVLQPVKKLFAHADFAFPATTVVGEVRGYSDGSEPEDALVGAAMLIIRDHFPASQLAIGLNPPWLDLSAARALYEQSTGRKASATSDFVPFMSLVPAPEGYRGPSGGSGPSRTLVALVVLVVLGFAFAGRGTGSYYLFWLVAPTVIAFASAHPWLLAIVPVGLFARRWLPDPLLWLRRARRVSTLRSRVHASPDDAVAQRQLAMLYLELRRPRAALPLIERALTREPDSAELLFLRGVAMLGQRQWQAAVDAFIAVLQIDARFRYGEPYLRMADALARLDRWKDAEESLEFFLGINGSSLEGWTRLAAARAKRDPGGREASARTRLEARRVYAQLPGFQRRQQWAWYLRTFV